MFCVVLGLSGKHCKAIAAFDHVARMATGEAVSSALRDCCQTMLMNARYACATIVTSCGSQHGVLVCCGLADTGSAAPPLHTVVPILPINHSHDCNHQCVGRSGRKQGHMVAADDPHTIVP